MPYPSPPRTLSGPRRRSLFATAAGAALLMGCSPGSGGSSEEESAGGPSVSDRVRARAARDSAALSERYAAVLAAHPKLAGRLSPLRAEVVRHVEAFGDVEKGGKKDRQKPSPSPSPSPAPSAATTAPVPVDEKAALAGLAEAERALADARTTALLEVPGELARLLASVAAAGAAHAFLLTEGAR
ncbi:hypothetical protein [Streptomyces sp. NPDC018693]|uniref:hypothetical protein n=1 Tax=unclassified Streptomyces TaxID=2593676 RepID=UPI0037ABC7E8